MPIRQRAALLQKLHRALVDSALAENRLQHDRAGIVIDRGAQAFDIVLLHERHLFEQRLESLAMFVLAGQRQRSKRAPVIRAVQRHQPALRLAARAMSRQTRQLDRSFDRLGPAVREERAVQSRKRAQLLRQRPLVFVVVEIRNVHQLRRLIANRLHDPRMRVPQRIHAQSRKQNRDSACPRCRKETRPCPGSTPRGNGCRSAVRYCRSRSAICSKVSIGRSNFTGRCGLRKDHHPNVLWQVPEWARCHCTRAQCRHAP